MLKVSLLFLSMLVACTALSQAPAPVQQSITVTTTRSSVDVGPTANTTDTLDADELTQYPALTLDEVLRQHAGFELFRRSSSWVANPTSEGISLRGLGSTAASRTLVLGGGVPLNDPFGGWVHWNELPPLTIDAVTLASGGGSDLYGSSALGGVIDIVAAHPSADFFEADLGEAAEATTSVTARGDLREGRWGELLAGQTFQTEGYTVVAPAIRGPIDIPSNVHFENGRFEVDRTVAKAGRAFLVGNVLNEAHNNGTPIQTNGTRLWRYLVGDDWTGTPRLNGRVRAFGDDEAYRQTFSSINAARTAETFTRAQRTETQEVGASADAAFHLAHVALIAGGDLRDLRALDFENPITGGVASGILDITARQRFIGGFGEVVAERHRWSIAGSLRADRASNLARNTIAQTFPRAAVSTATPDRNEVVLSPRVGVVRQLSHSVAIHAAGFRAFRAPTMNELYRTGQVGQQTTLPNSALLSERATGAEAGATYRGARVKAQATYFFTEINRPVSTVQLSSTATSVTLERENLGQIQSQGVELAAQVQATRRLSVDVGFEYAHAIVTAFAAQPGLVGLRIPDVPRESVTGQVRYRPDATTTVTLAAREIGRAFDDTANTFELHGFFVLDAYAERAFGSHLSAYFTVQNLLNRSIETARTPNLTLGTPVLAKGGVRVQWGGH